MLLDDIESGTRGPAAVLAKEETNEIQIVTIVGAITGGDFTLDYDPGDGGDLQTTAGIPYNATPRQLQEALEELDSINPGDVAVSFGKIVRRRRRNREHIHALPLGHRIHRPICGGKRRNCSPRTAAASPAPPT